MYNNIYISIYIYIYIYIYMYIYKLQEGRKVNKLIKMHFFAD